MLKFALFALLTMLTGSVWFAILVVLAVYLLIDVQYLGVSRVVLRYVRTARDIGELRRDVTINPHNAAAQNDLGRMLIQNGRYADAVAPLERAIERLADSDETNYYLGLAYLQTGRDDDGRRLIRKAIEMNPRFRYGEPFLRLGEYELAHGRLSEARELFERFEQIHSSSVEGFFLHGELYRRLGDADAARRFYRKAIDAFRRSPFYKRRDERRWLWKARLALWRMSRAI